MRKHWSWLIHSTLHSNPYSFFSSTCDYWRRFPISISVGSVIQEKKEEKKDQLYLLDATCNIQNDPRARQRNDPTRKREGCSQFAILSALHLFRRLINVDQSRGENVACPVHSSLVFCEGCIPASYSCFSMAGLHRVFFRAQLQSLSSHCHRELPTSPESRPRLPRQLCYPPIQKPGIIKPDHYHTPMQKQGKCHWAILMLTLQLSDESLADQRRPWQDV